MLPFLLLITVICGTFGLINYGQEGDTCDRNDSNWYAVHSSRHHFIYCHPKHGIYMRDQCAIVNGQRKIFDPKMQQCILTGDTPFYMPMSNRGFFFFGK